MSFMQPQVCRRTWIEVDTPDGTIVLPGDLFTSAGIAMLHKASINDVSIAGPLLKDYIPCDIDDVEAIEVKEGWGARLSAPGYMDCTEWSVYETEKKAWTVLIDEYPEAFTWTVELTADDDAGTAHIYMASDAAGKAMKEAVQSLGGANLERDGAFVYAALPSDEDGRNAIRTELDDAGFETEEG